MTRSSSLPESRPPRPEAAPEAAPCAVLVLDEHGVVQDLDRAADALLTCAAEEGYGRPVAAVLPAPVGNQVRAAAEHTGAEGVPVSLALYHPAVQRWFGVRTQATAAGVTVTFRDRTYRRQYGALLHLLDTAVLDGLWRVTPGGTIHTANAAVARLLGHDDPSSLEGADIEQFLVAPACWAALRATHSEETPAACTFRRADGTHVPGRMHLTPVRGAEGQVRAFDGTVIPERGPAESAGREGVLERAVEATDDAIAVLGPGPLTPSGPEVVYVSPAFTDLTGYPAEEIVGSSLRVLYGPDTEGDVLRDLRAHMEEGRPYRGETMLYRRDGTPYVGRWSVAPVRDAAGALTHWVVRQRDVTERRGATSLLNTHEARAETLYTALDPLLQAQTVEQVGTAVTEILRDALGLARAVVRERAGAHLVPLAATEEAAAVGRLPLDGDHAAAQAWHAESAVGSDAHLHLPLGRHGVLSVAQAAEETLPVRLLDTLASHAATILDRVATAASQRRAHERCDALRAAGRALLQAPSGAAGAEAAFDALAPVLPEGVCCRLLSFAAGGEQGRVRAANGVPLDGLERGDPWPVAAGRPPASGGVLYAADDLAQTASTDLEQHLAAAGFRSLVAAPLAPEGTVRGVLLLAAEPPEAFSPAQRVVAQEAADLLGHRLASAGGGDEALRSALLANVHHELRTPLTSIIGFAEVLGREEAGTNRFADLIARSGRRLKDTFDKLLTLSRLEAGTMPVESGFVSVAAEARTAVRAFEETAQAAGVGLEWDGAEGPVDAALDASGLHDVLRQLLDNAVRFTEAGGTVVVRLRTAGEEVVLSVVDTGIGMDPERVPDLFEPFRQGSTGLNRSHEGCGLGLSIVEGWAEAMGGAVEVETARGEGTTVTVRLPRLSEEAP